MSVATKIQAILRGTSEERNPEVDKANQLIVTQGYLPYSEVTRRGLGWQAMTTAGVAAVVVRPSTLSLATLYNKTTSPYHLYIDEAFAFNLVSTAAQARSNIWLCSHPVGQTAPTGNNITVRNSTSGKAAGDGGHTVFDTDEAVADDGWFPWGPWGDVEPTGTLPGGCLVAPVQGRIIVPPGAGISGTVVASLAGDTYTFGFRWYAVPNAEAIIG